jgi:hypothetical protein
VFQYFIGLTTLEALDLIQNGDLSDIDIDGWSDDDMNFYFIFHVLYNLYTYRHIIDKYY